MALTKKVICCYRKAIMSYLCNSEMSGFLYNSFPKKGELIERQRHYQNEHKGVKKIAGC